mgnify:CR=1 FL=1
MDMKKIITITVIGLLALSSIFAFSQMQDAKKDLKQVTELNQKLDSENKKLLKANERADKKIDELAKKYDDLNKELTELKAQSQINY